MTLKELIRKRIEENVPDYDISKIERYEYLIEMIAIEHAGEVVKNISSKPVLADSGCDNCAYLKQGSNPDNYCLVCKRMVEL